MEYNKTSHKEKDKMNPTFLFSEVNNEPNHSDGAN